MFIIFHVFKDQEPKLIIYFVISRTFLDDRRIAINTYLFSRHSPSCFILWILLWQGIKFKRWEHFTYILKLYKLAEIVFLWKKLLWDFVILFALFNIFCWHFRNEKIQNEMKMNVRSRMCDIFYCSCSCTRFLLYFYSIFNQRWDQGGTQVWRIDFCLVGIYLWKNQIIKIQ